MSEQQAPLVSVRDLRKHYALNGGLLRKGAAVKAVDGVSFDIQPGETFGLVGESGCGKSTLGRAILRLFDITAGEIHFAGQAIAHAREKELKPLRKRMQAIFQDPYSSLSALDVSVQAQVVNILQDLQQELGLTYLFIAHDLSMVRHISSRIGVMYLGKLVEVAPANELYQRPAHPYTRALLAAVPQPDPRIRNLEDATLRGEMPGPTSALPGCKFCSRCPHAMPVCQTQEPAMQEIAPGHFAACWLFKM